MHSTAGIFQIPLADTCGCLHSKPSFLFSNRILISKWDHHSSPFWIMGFCQWVHESISQHDICWRFWETEVPFIFLENLLYSPVDMNKTVASSCRGIGGAEEQSLTTVEAEPKEWREKQDIGHVHLSFNQVTYKFHICLLMAKWPWKMPINFPGLLFPPLCNSDNCALLMVLWWMLH